MLPAVTRHAGKCRDKEDHGKEGIMEKTISMKTISMKTIMQFFGYTNLPEFAADWAQLNAKDKAQIKSGILDGTLNY